MPAWTGKWRILGWSAILLLLHGQVGGALGQCRGDVDGDGRIGSGDLLALFAELFPPEAGLPLRAGEDANGDGVVSSADIVAVIQRSGEVCPATPTPTSRPVVTASVAATGTRTPTRTPTPVRTATETATPGSPLPARCEIRSLPVGTVDAELTTSDCLRPLAGRMVPADVYEVTGRVGEALAVEVVPEDPSGFRPWVSIVDPAGQFGDFGETPPIEWSVRTQRPYRLTVMAADGSPSLTGRYRLTIRSRACPGGRVINLATGYSGSNLRLDANSCPEPANPTAAGFHDPAHFYTFEITQVPIQVDILMRKMVEDEDHDPRFALLGPTGVEVANPDLSENLGGGAFEADARVRFLALQRGTYTLVTSGGEGRYALIVTSSGTTSCRRSLTSPGAGGIFSCPGQPGGCSGTLFGDRRRGTCAAPLPRGGEEEELPELGAGSNILTFQAEIGDTISAEVRVEGGGAFAHLLGPASASYPVLAVDGDFLTGAESALVSTTVTVSGTYMLIVSSASMLLEPDPFDPEDQGDRIDYSVSLRKCSAAGFLDVGSSSSFQSSLGVTDCRTTGQRPVRNFVLGQEAGPFVSVSVAGNRDLTPAVSLISGDGSFTSSEVDPLEPSAARARVSRILPAGGPRFVQVRPAESGLETDFTEDLSFSLRGRECASRSVQPGVVAGVIDSTFCEIDPGRRYEVLRIENDNVPRVLTVAGDASTCLMGLLPDGPQLPTGECAVGELEIPMLRAGSYGIVVASRVPTDRQLYTVRVARCPVQAVGFADEATGTLGDEGCFSPTGQRERWLWVRDTVDAVRFNGGVVVEFQSGSGTSGRWVGPESGFPLPGFTLFEPEEMLDLGGFLGGLVRLRGPQGGEYRLRVEPALLRY